ncbi:hypothetical protein AB0L70_12055 [Kribbella sp. NPDC051952]|uniref:hypothetical protein n=1 Tax=Kribbella sp. NPDC051952 TaxID=3154851 RepID=UPI003432E30F
MAGDFLAGAFFAAVPPPVVLAADFFAEVFVAGAVFFAGVDVLCFVGSVDVAALFLAAAVR